MSSLVDIRPISKVDKAIWTDLWTDYLTFYKTQKSNEVYAATWGRLFDENPRNVKGALAWYDGQAIGLVHWFDHAHSGYVQDICYLQDLYVSSVVRGKGVGKSLIEHVYAYADSKNMPQVYWTTQAHNVVARRLYDHIADDIGFVKYASQRKL